MELPHNQHFPAEHMHTLCLHPQDKEEDNELTPGGERSQVNHSLCIAATSQSVGL